MIIATANGIANPAPLRLFRHSLRLNPLRRQEGGADLLVWADVPTTGKAALASSVSATTITPRTTCLARSPTTTFATTTSPASRVSHAVAAALATGSTSLARGLLIKLPLVVLSPHPVSKLPRGISGRVELVRVPQLEIVRALHRVVVAEGRTTLLAKHAGNAAEEGRVVGLTALLLEGLLLVCLLERLLRHTAILASGLGRLRLGVVGVA